MDKNDKTILELRDKIEKKKAELKEDKKYKTARLTNLRIETFSNIPKNISVMSENQLNIVKAMLKSIISNSDVELFSDDGYKYSDILVDVQNISREKKHNAELNKLKLAEKKLKELLTDKVQTELEIDNIVNDLDI